MATFITSRPIGQGVSFNNIETTEGYWKYLHNDEFSSVFEDSSSQGAIITNANGEFTIIPCLSDGTESGEITIIDIQYNGITSFDGTGLSGLTVLFLQNNQLTSFDGTGLSSLTQLYLNTNQITSFDGTGLSSLTYLDLNYNQLTSFDGTGLSSLT